MYGQWMFQSNKISYCRGTAWCTILVNSCYVSRAMEVIKASNSKSDLQVHSRALDLVPFDRLHRFPIRLVLQLCQSCTVSEILSVIYQNLNMSHDSEHIPIGSNTSCMLSCCSINLYTKFEVPSFTKYKDMIGGKFKNKNRVMWPWPRPF